MQADISVVIPCYNAARFLAECVESIRAQTVPAVEIIIVDDCSTDDSLVVARELGLVCLSTGQNAGPASARNQGVRAAKGDLIAFLDADDVWDADHLESILAAFEQVPEAVLAFGSRRLLGVAEMGRNPRYAAPMRPLHVYAPLFETNMIPQSAVVLRRDAFLREGGYTDGLRYSEDYELWIRLARAGVFVYTGRTTMTYRVHPNQASTGVGALRLFESAWNTRLREWRRVTELPRPDEAGRCGDFMRDGLRSDLEEAWSDRCGACVDFLLTMCTFVPMPEKEVIAWRTKRRWMWPVWSTLSYAIRHAPGPLRSLIRRGRG